MQKSKLSETQIVGILKDAESGMPVADLLRKRAVSTPVRQPDSVFTVATPRC